MNSQPEMLESRLEEERCRADAAEQRLRDQTLLFAEAEHKLKTFLAVITGWAATLDDGWDRLDDATRRRGVSAIRTASRDLTALADVLLDDARAEMTGGSERVRLDLAEVLAATTSLYEGVSRAHDVYFVGSDKEVWVEVDPGALQQVLGHLVENAVKYSPNGGPIALDARTDGASALLTVTDRGIGIPTDVDLFAPFQRGRHEGIGGAGLGLYIVRNLVEHMGGSITASPNEGAGSTFTVTLPRA